MDADSIITKIANVEIQGATAVARTGVELLQELDQQDASNDELDAVAERLKAARPTEPFLFNAVDMARETGDYDRVLDHITASQDTIQDIGSGLLEDAATVFTHCHSSTVTGILRDAHERGTDMTVRCTETRPLYQGRKTASELSDAGIPVQLYVDSGARIALKGADVMVIGADAITATGTVVNKIGSELFAEVANRYDVPVYVCTDSWKFDARSRFGYHEPLERRVADEVWPDAPDGVDVVNYAFEHVHPDSIDGIVSELGVLPPDGFPQQVQQEYPAIVDPEKA